MEEDTATVDMEGTDVECIKSHINPLLHLTRGMSFEFLTESAVRVSDNTRFNISGLTFALCKGNRNDWS